MTPSENLNAVASHRPSLLVVDDDEEIVQLLTRYLNGHGFQVFAAGSAAQSRAVMGAESIDLVLLDLGLPDEDGLSLLKDLQSIWNVSVIVVTGRGDAVERIVGLELGADDYVTKPFDFRELVARIRTVLRRARTTPETAPPKSQVLTFDRLKLDLSARQLSDREGRDIPLTTGEFDLLQVLLKHPRQILSRDQLMNHIHGRDAGPFDRAIDVQIARLRRKLETDPNEPRLIKSVRGAGYLFAADVRRL
jgi:two-component system, OmpR family, response regulator